jgi:hypothetical protein
MKLKDRSEMKKIKWLKTLTIRNCILACYGIIYCLLIVSNKENFCMNQNIKIHTEILFRDTILACIFSIIQYNISPFMNN